MSTEYQVQIWNLTREQALVLWQLAHEWDSQYEGPRFDGWIKND